MYGSYWLYGIAAVTAGAAGFYAATRPMFSPNPAFDKMDLERYDQMVVLLDASL
jgi:hypothetical protein